MSAQAVLPIPLLILTGLSAVILAAPDDNQAELLRARSYFLGDEHLAAEPLLRSYLKEHPGSAEAHALLGAVLAGLNEMEEAERALRESVRLDPQQAPALKQLAFVLHRRGRNEEAAREARRSLDIYASDAEAHLLLGLACYAQNDLTCTIRASQEAVRLRAEFLDAQILLAQALTDNQQYENAAFVLELAHQTNSRIGTKSEKPALLHGQLLMALGRPEHADKMFAQALQFNARSVPALVGLARTRLAADDFKKAAEYAETARLLEPDNESVYALLLRAYRGLGDVAKTADAARWLEDANTAKLRGRGTPQ